MDAVQQTIAALKSGDRRITAKLITSIENGSHDVDQILQALYRDGGGTPVIGITGPPGAGKSTLVDQLIDTFRKRRETVAVLAVDPSSASSGGAILGDRVRMRRHNTDPGVFIRSMSARGKLGGLSSASGDALIVLDAIGFDYILIETVGVGQSEIDILNYADTVVVVQTPSAGDRIQAIKAGLLEIADIFAVNKSDTVGADAMRSALAEAVNDFVDHGADDWLVPVVKTQASSGKGLDELKAAIDAHIQYLSDHPRYREDRNSARTRRLLIDRTTDRIRHQYGHSGASSARFEKLLHDVLAREIDPASAAKLLVGEE